MDYQSPWQEIPKGLDEKDGDGHGDEESVEIWQKGHEIE